MINIAINNVSVYLQHIVAVQQFFHAAPRLGDYVVSVAQAMPTIAMIVGMCKSDAFMHAPPLYGVLLNGLDGVVEFRSTNVLEILFQHWNSR
jgi:hypothetical protein